LVNIDSQNCLAKGNGGSGKVVECLKALLVAHEGGLRRQLNRLLLYVDTFRQ
jgi:hypothetical protein